MEGGGRRWAPLGLRRAGSGRGSRERRRGRVPLMGLFLGVSTRGPS